MSFSDYFHESDLIDFELETISARPMVTCRVTDVKENMLTVSVEQNDFSADFFRQASKGIVWGKKRGLKYSLYVEIEDVRDDGTLILRHIPARTHLRVDAYMIFRYRPISYEEFQKKRNLFIQTQTHKSDEQSVLPSRFINDDNELQTMLPPELISEIQSIHRKLDFIIKILGQTSEDTIFNREPTAVNISGSGLRFRCNENLNPGSFLEIELVLPLSSGILIELIGEVVRCTELHNPEEGGGDERYDVGVNFAAINEDDREYIIKYVFKRQRELLRSTDTGTE